MLLKQAEKLLGNEAKISMSGNKAFKIVFSTSKYIRAVVCLVFLKMAYNSFYFGVQGCLERTGFNFGVSLFMLGFGQFTGFMSGSMIISLFSEIYPENQKKKSVIDH